MHNRIFRSIFFFLRVLLCMCIHIGVSGSEEVELTHRVLTKKKWRCMLDNKNCSRNWYFRVFGFDFWTYLNMWIRKIKIKAGLKKTINAKQNKYCLTDCIYTLFTRSGKSACQHKSNETKAPNIHDNKTKPDHCEILFPFKDYFGVNNNKPKYGRANITAWNYV